MLLDFVLPRPINRVVRTHMLPRRLHCYSPQFLFMGFCPAFPAAVWGMRRIGNSFHSCWAVLIQATLAVSMPGDLTGILHVQALKYQQAIWTRRYSEWNATPPRYKVPNQVPSP